MSLQDFVGKHVSSIETRGLRPTIGDAGREIAMWGLGMVDKPLRTPIWNEKWDVCLVLDACRVDLMQSVAGEYEFLPETIGKEWSVGSASPEWISNTFAPAYREHIKQTAYVTANAFSGKTGQDNDYLDDAVVPLSTQPFAYLDEVYVDQWNANVEQEIVEPSTMTGRGLHAYDTADADRLIVHYMQPHMPFRSHPEWFDGWGGTENFGDVNKQRDTDVWIKLKHGELDEREFWRAYRDNLRWVLDEVQKWVYHVDGRILITSDHGNAKGEWGLWSHPPGMASPELRWVPWVLVDGKGLDVEYDVVGNPPVVAGENESVNAQLESLGYR